MRPEYQCSFLEVSHSHLNRTISLAASEWSGFTSRVKPVSTYRRRYATPCPVKSKLLSKDQNALFICLRGTRKVGLRDVGYYPERVTSCVSLILFVKNWTFWRRMSGVIITYKGIA